MTIRLIFSLAISYNWPLQQLDVNNAFLNGILEEDVYMTQPPGFVPYNKLQVRRLHKTIYGLKQAPRAWFDKLKATILNLKFSSSKCGRSLFVFSDNKFVVYIWVYIDDIIAMGNNTKLIHSLVSQLNYVLSLKDLCDLDYFLGIEVQRLKDGSLILTQSKYISDLLAKTKMDESNPISSLMVGGYKLSKIGSEDFSNPTLYRSIVGAL